MYLYTSQKTSKIPSNWQILKVPVDTGGIDLYVMPQPNILSASFLLFKFYQSYFPL